ncbi:MAG: hypothetical protein E6I90_08615, partial [Chloroflexi bacterium]
MPKIHCFHLRSPFVCSGGIAYLHYLSFAQINDDVKGCQQWGTALLLVGLTIFNALLGLNQEGKAEASVAALQKMMIVKSKVRRGGQMTELPAEQIVPGDIVVLEAGDRVPADGRIIRSATLEIGESALTGESAPVPKQVEPVDQADTPLGDRVDMAYMNTEVTR